MVKGYTQTPSSSPNPTHSHPALHHQPGESDSIPTVTKIKTFPPT